MFTLLTIYIYEIMNLSHAYIPTRIAYIFTYVYIHTHICMYVCVHIMHLWNKLLPCTLYANLYIHIHTYVGIYKIVNAYLVMCINFFLCFLLRIILYYYFFIVLTVIPFSIVICRYKLIRAFTHTYIHHIHYTYIYTYIFYMRAVKLIHSVTKLLLKT